MVESLEKAKLKIGFFFFYSSAFFICLEYDDVGERIAFLFFIKKSFLFYHLSFDEN